MSHREREREREREGEGERGRERKSWYCAAVEWTSVVWELW